MGKVRSTGTLLLGHGSVLVLGAATEVLARWAVAILEVLDPPALAVKVPNQPDDAQGNAVLVGVDQRMQIVPVLVKVQFLTCNLSPCCIERLQDCRVSLRLVTAHGVRSESLAIRRE